MRYGTFARSLINAPLSLSLLFFSDGAAALLDLSVVHLARHSVSHSHPPDNGHRRSQSFQTISYLDIENLGDLEQDYYSTHMFLLTRPIVALSEVISDWKNSMKGRHNPIFCSCWVPFRIGPPPTCLMRASLE